MKPPTTTNRFDRQDILIANQEALESTSESIPVHSPLHAVTGPPAKVSLDSVLENALLSCWTDVGATGDTLMHIEYHRQSPSLPLEYLRIWSSVRIGSWDLVCHYRMFEGPLGDPQGVTFHAPFYSADLGYKLQVIMQNQDRFADLAEPTRDGLVQVSAPTEASLQRASATLLRTFRDSNLHLELS
jgi:hypothetical protein